jgi:hypothetical protein
MLKCGAKQILTLREKSAGEISAMTDAEIDKILNNAQEFGSMLAQAKSGGEGENEEEEEDGAGSEVDLMQLDMFGTREVYVCIICMYVYMVVLRVCV